MLFRILSTILFVILVASQASVSAQVIRFPECIYTATIGVPLDLPLSYEGSNAIIGANVRVTGLPTEWIVVAIPPSHVNPCGTTGCDLFGDGAHLTFPSCAGVAVPLFHIQVVPLTVESNLVITPEKTLDSPIDCPSVVLCDDPVFTVQCVGCDQAFINHSEPFCGLPVEQLTWSRVRTLYR